nr:hypothetical protein [Tanacetum cinerariifolium]
MSSYNLSAQNMVFVSSSNNNSTNGVVNTASGISTAGTQVSNANIDKLGDDVIYAFLESQPSSPQLVNKDLKQIHPDDLEEMDLKWQMAMLTIRARRVQSFKDNKQKESTRRNMPIETPASTSLVSYDGLGGYGWSNQAEESSTNFALMAYSSARSNSEVSADSNCSSSCLENVKILKE